MAKKNKAPIPKSSSPTNHPPQTEQAQSLVVPMQVYDTFFSFLDDKMRLIILMLIGIVIYANTAMNEYALDDTIVLQQNLHVQDGVSGIKKILKREPFQNSFGNELLRKRYYRQLSIVTFAIEHQFFGDNPAVSHTLNVLFYSLLIGVMYKLLREFFFKTKPDIAFFASLIFAVHPLHTEVVANIKSRDEIFCFLFCLSALYLAFKYYQSSSKPIGTLIGACVCYFMALLSKENAIVFWAVFPLSFFYFLDKKTEVLRTKKLPFAQLKTHLMPDLTRALRLSLPFLGVFFLYFIFRAGAIGIDTSVDYYDKLHNRFFSVPLSESFPTKIYFWLLYLKLLFVPYPLIWDYSYNAIPFIHYRDYGFWLTILIYAGIKLWALWQLPKRNPISYGIFFYIGTLFLVSGLVINIGGYFAERFLFQPSFGFAIVIGTLFYELLSLLKQKSAGLIYPVLGLFGLIILAGCGQTIMRNPVWKNNETLFTHDIQFQPNSALVNKACAGILLSKSGLTKDEKLQRQHRDKAYPYYYKAYQIYPQYADALINLGFIHYMNEEYPQAEQYWGELKRLYPTHPQLRENTDLIYNKLLSFANDAFNRKDIDAYMKYSLRAYRFAAEGDEKVPLNMGLVYRDAEKPDSAAKYFRLACSIQPNNPEYWFELGKMYAKLNKIKAGKEAFQQTLKLNPNHTGARFYIDNAPPEEAITTNSAK